jgi:polyisoprenoid-binding protein YceI
MSRWMAALIGLFVINCCSLSPAQAETSPDASTEAPPHEYANWYIDPHNSVIRFFATEFAIKKVKGVFDTAYGTVQYDGKSPESIRVHAEIDSDSIDTAIKMRDRTLKGDDFLKVSRYPFIIFDSTRIVPSSPGHFRMYGNLKIRQYTKEVVVDVNGPGPFTKTIRGMACFNAHATARLDKKDFGINGGAGRVGDEIPVVMTLRIVEGGDPDAGIRASERQKNKDDFQANENYKRSKGGH